MTRVDDSPAWLERDDGTRVPVAPSCAIGRAPGNELVLADEKVSRKHALVHKQGEGEYWLVDLGSSNGSYLDDRRVTRPSALRDGSVLRIGSTTLVFRQRAAPAPEDTSWTEGTVHDIRVAPCWLLVADIEGSTELSRSIPAAQLPAVIGGWFSECKQVIDAHGGAINKYLGDGFFAYWIAIPGSLERVAAALVALHRRQGGGPLRFRIVVHHGDVSLGGAASMGEESLSGPDVNFVFRLEKLAGSLGRPTLLSAAARAQLAGTLATAPAGRHPLSGFDGTFEVFTLA